MPSSTGYAQSQFLLLCGDDQPTKHHHNRLTIMNTHACRSVVASEGLGVWGGLWIQVMGDLLLPLMADLARFVSTRARDFPGESQKCSQLKHQCLDCGGACIATCSEAV